MTYYYIYQHTDHLRARLVGSHTSDEIDYLVSLDTGVPVNEVNWYGLGKEASDPVDAIEKFKTRGSR